MAQGPEGRKEGRGVESPPAPEVGGWWEYRAGDATEYVVLGTALEDGVQKVSLMASVNLKEAAEKGTLATAVKVPLKEFEDTMTEVTSPRFDLGKVGNARKLSALYAERHRTAGPVETPKAEEKPASPPPESSPQDATGPVEESSADAKGDSSAPETKASAPAPVAATEATPAEQKQELKERIGSLQNLVEKNKSENVEQRKKAYFAALKKYQEERGRLGLMAEGVVGEFSSAEVKALRKEWIEARAAVARAQLDSVEDRLDARKTKAGAKPLEGLKEYRGKGSLDEDEVMERYRRLVTFRSVVMGAEEEEREVRLAALAEREQKLDAMDSAEKPWLERARAWYKRQPPGARILGTAAIMTGGAALAFGAGPLALVAGAGSAGMRWYAEARKSKNPELSETAYGLSRLTSIGGIIGAAVEGATVAAHKLGDSVGKAEKTLEARGGLGDLSDVKNFEKVSKMRKSAASVEENIARDRRRGRILGSLLGGAILGGLSSDEAHASGSSDVGHASGTAEAGSSVGTESPHAETPTTDAPQAAEAPVAQAPAAPAASEAPAATPEVHDTSGATTGAETLVHETPTSPEGMTVSASIDTQGEGTNQLFLDLREQIRANEALTQHPTPAVQHLLDTNVNQLSRDLGTEAWNSSANDNGLLTHMGDRVLIDENQNVWIQQGDNPPQLYIENVDTSVDPSGIKIHTIDPAFESTASPAVVPEAPRTAGETEDLLAEPGTVSDTPDTTPVTPETVTSSTEGSAAGTTTGAEVSPDSPPTLGTALGDPGQMPAAETNAPTSAEPLGRSMDMDSQTGASMEPLAWRSGNALPTEPSFFKYFDTVDGKEVFYANGMQPNQFIEFASQHGIDLRGTVVRFDNPVATFGGMTHQINQVEFGVDGRPVSGVEPVMNASGTPEQYLDTRFLKERIA